jgi:plastocyanin
MKTTVTSIFAIIVSAFGYGQMDHTVNAQATSWSPNDLTITMGDSVTWINNNSGLHNLNGMQATYPGNPESFGMLTSSQNWTYGYRFLQPGVYNYRCDVHFGMMIGKVTVQTPLGIENNEVNTFSFYPNPVTDKISISADSHDFTVTIFDMMGGKVLTKRMFEDNVLDVSLLQSGFYLIQISSEKGIQQERMQKI